MREAADILRTLMSHGAYVSPFRVTAAGPALTEAAMRGIVAQALRLKAASAAGVFDKPLRGKNIALLRRAIGEPTPLQRAATDLGAQVAQLPMHDPQSASTARAELADLAQMLSRLYDAVDCGGVDAALCAMLCGIAGVTVYDRLGDDTHPARALAVRMGTPHGTIELGDNHHFVLQALLISTLDS